MCCNQSQRQQLGQDVDHNSLGFHRVWPKCVNNGRPGPEYECDNKLRSSRTHTHVSLSHSLSLAVCVCVCQKINGWKKGMLSFKKSNKFKQWHCGIVDNFAWQTFNLKISEIHAK